MPFSEHLLSASLELGKEKGFRLQIVQEVLFNKSWMIMGKVSNCERENSPTRRAPWPWEINKPEKDFFFVFQKSSLERMCLVKLLVFRCVELLTTPPVPHTASVCNDEPQSLSQNHLEGLLNHKLLGSQPQRC